MSLPKEWILEGAVRPDPIIPPKPNTQIREITQFQDGRVKLSFDRCSISSNNSEGSST